MEDNLDNLDNFEVLNTDEGTPDLFSDKNFPNKSTIKDLIINPGVKNYEKEEILNINKIPNINNNSNNPKNKKKINSNNIILIQRENRKIMFEIKNILSNKGNVDINIKKLLIKDILNNYNRNISLISDDKKNTLLHLYVQKNDINSLEIILNIYSDILDISENFYNFLFSKNLENKTVFEIACQNNYISIIKLLFSQIEKENNYKEKKKYMNYFRDNIFHICSEYDQCYMVIFFYEELRKFYKFFNIKQILNINYKDEMNPLHIACEKGNKKILNLLIDLGGDINSKDINGFTPLHYTVITENENLAKILILRGADKFIKDNNNHTPYDLALLNNNEELIELLYHKNFCQNIFCGEEIGPLVKTKNHIFLLLGIVFTIILKLLIIFRFECVLNDINFDIYFKKRMSFDNYNSNLNDNITRNNDDKISEELSLNDFFICIDDGCRLEVAIIFSTLFSDLFILFIIILVKCSKNIFLEKKSEKEVESLSLLYENSENICVKCRISINNNTKHCLICDKCVNNWDHHCYWINTCINDKNYTKFKLFLFSIFLFLVSDLIYYSISFYLLYNSKELFMDKIINLNNQSLLSLIIKIIFMSIDIYIIIIIVYSLLFILIPIIKYNCSISNNEINEENEENSDLFKNMIESDIINNHDNSIDN